MMYQAFPKEQLAQGIYIRLQMMNDDKLRALCDQLAELYLTLIETQEKESSSEEAASPARVAPIDLRC